MKSEWTILVETFFWVIPIIQSIWLWKKAQTFIKPAFRIAGLIFFLQLLPIIADAVAFGHFYWSSTIDICFRSFLVLGPTFFVGSYFSASLSLRPYILKGPLKHYPINWKAIALVSGAVVFSII